jgi:DNA mismatch repair protein MutS2
MRQLSVPAEVHLRRMKVRDALDKLERYLNDAAVGGLPWARIVHGKGTGTLKRAVIEHLSGHPLVARCYPAAPSEGGGGVTIAEMK